MVSELLARRMPAIFATWYHHPQGTPPLLILIPSALQMGWWKELPAAFCAATETAQDIIQAHVDKSTELPHHNMEEFMAPAHPTKKQKLNDGTAQVTYVYVDNFILAAMENSTRTHTPDHPSPSGSVWDPCHISAAVCTGNKNGKDPISKERLIKELLNGHRKRQSWDFG